MARNVYFKNKVALITGASSGIGKATAIKLAGLGARVALVSRNRAKLESVANGIVSHGGDARALPADVSSLQDMQQAADAVISNWNTVDILIANAGQYVQGKIVEMDLTLFEKALAVNFYGTVNTIKAVLPEMLKNETGHIVIVNSLDAKKGIVGDGPYVAAKSALEGMGDVLRQELKVCGIHVASVYPGRVDTPMIDHLDVPRVSPKISPETVAHGIIKGIKKKKASIFVPISYYPLGALNHLFPEFMDWCYAALKLEGRPF